IEAVIMDVSANRSTDFGLGYHGGTTFQLKNEDDSTFFVGNNAGASIGVPSLDSLQALAIGVRGPTIESAGLSIPSLGVFLHAVAQDGDSNILATPHILATDNIPAEISIGENIPLQTNIGGLGNTLSALGGAAGSQASAASALGSLSLLGGGGQAQRQD